VGTSSATSVLITAMRVHANTTRMAIAANPMSSDDGSIRDGWISTDTALANGKEPSASAPVRSEICPATMLTATPVRKPEHDRVRHEPGVPTEARQPGDDRHHTGEHGQEEQGIRSVFRVDVGDRRARCECRRAGRADDHQPGARGEAADRRSHETRVQTVHRVDPGQYGTT
jgi:hypothetical protein